MNKPTRTRNQPVAEVDRMRRGPDEEERQSAEETPDRQCDDRYRVLVQTIPHGIQECDGEGRITFANEALHQIHGYSPGELVGKFVWDMLAADDDKEEFRQYLQYLVEQQPSPTTYTAVNRGRNGATYDVQVDWDYCRDSDGTLTGFIAVVTDVTHRNRAEEMLRRGRDDLEQRINARTRELARANRDLTREIAERKLAEDAARKSEELYHRVFDSAADGLLLVGQDGKISQANQAACEMFGYSAEELAGREVTQLIHPDDRHLFEQVSQQLFTHGSAQVEAVNLHKDGSQIFIELRATLFTFYDTIQALCVVRDLTARRRAEQAVEAEQCHLRRLLEMHEHDRQLVAYEIHDGFVQSLVGARMLLDASRKHVPDDKADSYERAVQLIDRGIEESRRLISGQRPLILDERGLMAAIEHLVCELQPEDCLKIIYEDRVSFERLVPPLETAIFRVVQEGLNNAQRHSKSPKILLSVTQVDHRLRIQIQDWGVGFDPGEISQRCFGLEGIRERARLFGGSAEIDSTPGVGTTVTVEFPVVGREREDGD